MNASIRSGRFMATVAGAVSLSLLAGACGSDAQPVANETAAQVTTSTEAPTEGLPISAVDGAAAREAQAAALGRNSSAADAEFASAGIAADEPMGRCGTPYVPTAEEIAAANAETAALVAVLDTYGVSYETITDDLGFSYVQTDYKDVVAQSVVDSYWQNRYPPSEPEPIDPAELARIKSDNNAIAAALDAVSATYTRQSDESGWEWIEWDYNNADAQAAVEAAYAELYPPIPPTAEELASAKADTDKLAAAFDAAGIAYTRVSDEFGWEWLEWDYEDEVVSQAVMAVYDELYPVEPCGFLADDSIGIAEEAPLGDAPVIADAPAESADPAESGDATRSDVVEIAPVPLEDDGFTDEEIAQRDAEVAAMTAGFTAASVHHEVWGESPWASVTFDIENTAAIPVIKGIISARN